MANARPTSRQSTTASRAATAARKATSAASMTAAKAAVAAGKPMTNDRTRGNVITQNRGQVYSNGKLISDYGTRRGSDMRLSAEEMARNKASRTSGFGNNVMGTNDGATHRALNRTSADRGTTRPILNPGSKKVTRNLAAEQAALADVLKSGAQGGANSGIADGTSIDSLDEATKKSIIEGVNQRVYGTGTPDFGVEAEAPTDVPTADPEPTGDATVDPGTGTDEQINRPVLTGGDSGTELSGGSGSEFGMPDEPRSLQEIRQEQIDRYQSIVDATQAVFNSDMDRLINQGSAEMARTSSMAVGAGLAGSPFQSTMEQGVQNATNQATQGLSAQRSAEVANLMVEAENRADTLYQAALDEYQQERDFYVDERDKAASAAEAKQAAAATAAKETIANLAAGGYSLDEMDSAAYQKLLSDSGKSDFEVRAIWAAATPAANATYSTQNGFLVGTYFDPITGKPVVTTTPMPPELLAAENPVMKTLEFGGNLYWYDENKPMNEDGSPNLISLGMTPDAYADSLEGTTPEVYDINGVDHTYDAETGTFVPIETTAIDPEILEAEKKAADEALALRDTADAVAQTLKGKLDLIKNIEESAGKKGVVGTYGVSRWTPFAPDKAERIGFFSSVKQLISQETLTTLLELKRAGGTLGALSNEERTMLENAASQINGWIKKDDKGNPTGKIEVSEKLFDAEIARIKKLTEAALARAQGDAAALTESAISEELSGDDMEDALNEAGYDPKANSAFSGAGKNSSAVVTSGSPLKVAESYLGLNAKNPKHAKTLSAFFKKAGGVNVDPTTTAWCAAFANSVLGASGVKGTGSLLAQSFLKFGTPVKTPTKGDIVVFERGPKGGWQGHVGFIAGVNKNGTLQVLGGNQDGSTNIQTYRTDRVLGYRRINQTSANS